MFFSAWRQRIRLLGIVLILVGRGWIGPASAGEGAPALDELLTDASVWQAGAEEFMLRYAPLKFGFVSGRAVARSVAEDLTIRGFRVWEALAYFKEGQIERLELSLFNHGDAGSLDQIDFERLLTAVHASLVQWGGNGRSGQATSDRTMKTVRHHQWAKPPCAAQLTWAFTSARKVRGESFPFRSEFIRLTLAYSPRGGIEGLSTLQTSTLKQGTVTARTLRERIKTDSEGYRVVTGMPMVDQGQKGYCAAATAERLLRFYGRDIDQHEVAQLADTARQQGTTTTGMLDALRTIGRQYQLDVKNLIDLDYNGLVKIVEDYNKVAASRGLEAMVLGNTIEVGALYSAMDASALKQAGARRRAACDSFLRDVTTYVEAGVPLIWACIVGKFPENPPLNIEGAFGHMRMIIGYHPRLRELVYTDSWGPGHEIKRIPLADAWAMTFGLYVMKPRGIR